MSAVIPKNRRESVVIRKRELHGQHYIDARVFFPGPDGELRPSGKGITVSIDQAGNLADAICEVARQEVADAD